MSVEVASYPNPGPVGGLFRRRDYVRELPSIRTMARTPLEGIANITHGTTPTLTWETASDWNSAASESGVVHESVANTDHSDDTQFFKGWNYTTPPASANNILYLPFDEDSGSTANDISGNGFDGSINGPTVGATSVLNTTGFDFDGSNDAVQVSNNATLENALSGDFSIATLFQTSATSVGRFQEHKTNSGQTTTLLNYSSSGNISFYDGAFSGALEASGSYNDGNYHLCVVVRDDSGGNRYIYVDGSEAASGNSTSGTSSDTAHYIGTRTDGSDPFSGHMGWYAMWDTALSSTQVSNLWDVLNTDGTLTTATKSFASAQTPDLQNLDYSLNGQSITLDVIGSPGTASEETVTQSLDGTTSFSLTWSNSHTDFRIKTTLSSTDDETTPTMNKLELAG